MKQRLSSPALADRGARLAGVGFTDRLVPRGVGALPTAQPTSQACAEPAAPSGPSPDGAVFSHFTESSCALRASEDRSCPVSPVDGQDVGRPAVVAPAAGALTSNAILLPDHVMVLVRAIAAYERCGNVRAVALALTEYAAMIGAGVLARAVADLDDDLAEVPAHARRAANRFRGGGP